MEVLQIVNAHYFEKEKKRTQGYMVFGLPVSGGHAMYLAKYRCKEKVLINQPSFLNVFKLDQHNFWSFAICDPIYTCF